MGEKGDKGDEGEKGMTGDKVSNYVYSSLWPSVVYEEAFNNM